MQITELAQEMGTTERELSSWLYCLKVWTDKGYTVEQAMFRHKQMLESIAAALTQRPNSEEVYALKDLVAEVVWNEVRA